jgi:hypothetical protein
MLHPRRILSVSLYPIYLDPRLNSKSKYSQLRTYWTPLVSYSDLGAPFLLPFRLATDTKISGVSVEISAPKKVVVGVGVRFSDTKNSGVGFSTPTPTPKHFFAF